MIYHTKLYILILCLILLNMHIDWGEASFLDYIWPDSKSNQFSSNIESLPSVPFEINEDRFIVDVAKVLGTKLSDLDFCQQRVVLHLKDHCKTLNDARLGRLAIALMNCQLQAEGKDIVECHENMSLGECTTNMVSNIRDLYNMFLGQTKAICLQIRQEQFRGLTEITINKLMDSANQHLQMLDNLVNSQKQVEKAALGSIDEMMEKNSKLLENQQDLLDLAETQRLNTETNLREILKEKNLLKSVQHEIVSFITSIKNKIDKGLLDIQDQNLQIKEGYKNLNGDINGLHLTAEKISSRLEEASESIYERSKKTTIEIDGTVTRLIEIMDLVQNISKELNLIQRDFNYNAQWLHKYFGEGEDAIRNVCIVLIHVTYLLVGMICLLFLYADFPSRVLFILIISLNLAAVLYKLIALDVALLTEIVIALLSAKIFIKLSRRMGWKKYAQYLTISETNNKPSRQLLLEQNGQISKGNQSRSEEISFSKLQSSESCYSARESASFIDHYNDEDRNRSSWESVSAESMTTSRRILTT